MLKGYCFKFNFNSENSTSAVEYGKVMLLFLKAILSSDKFI
jgi:hypothetical protein